MKYQFMTRRGAMSEAVDQTQASLSDPLANFIIAHSIIQLVPASVALLAGEPQKRLSQRVQSSVKATVRKALCRLRR